MRVFQPHRGFKQLCLKERKREEDLSQFVIFITYSQLYQTTSKEHTSLAFTVISPLTPLLKQPVQYQMHAPAYIQYHTLSEEDLALIIGRIIKETLRTLLLFR